VQAPTSHEPAPQNSSDRWNHAEGAGEGLAILEAREKEREQGRRLDATIPGLFSELTSGGEPAEAGGSSSGTTRWLSRSVIHC